MLDQFGDRIKGLENVESQRRFMSQLPVIVRLDGKSFHTFCKGLNQPYDIRLTQLMIATTKYLVEQSDAAVGYTQSDEISLILYKENYKSQIYFDGRIMKLVSVLASSASAYFNKYLELFLPEKKDKLVQFDCRAFQVPTLIEAANSILWREQDAVKNSISMAARNYYSDKELFKKSGKEMQDMLIEKGMNWNDYPDFFKRGTYVQRKVFTRTYTINELDKLPEKHDARKDSNLEVTRSEIQELNLSPLNRIENQIDVLIHGKEEILKGE